MGMIASVEGIRKLLNEIRQAQAQRLAEKSLFYNFNFATEKPLKSKPGNNSRFVWESMRLKKSGYELSKKFGKKRVFSEQSIETASDSLLDRRIKRSRTDGEEVLKN
eukprot:TRINITY_DN14289_c0_g2_i1.p1 TRINITY_DN14289_c0_g2~~TRINITY_DN14289_c0_g2_i1.p1  ORF type:complete len:107 (-),score=6.03 TRINITY_DN14289_c0_g2_i1:231-551(-)